MIAVNECTTLEQHVNRHAQTSQSNGNYYGATQKQVADSQKTNTAAVISPCSCLYQSDLPCDLLLNEHKRRDVSSTHTPQLREFVREPVDESHTTYQI